MRLVSPLLKKVVYPAMQAGGWLGRSLNGQCAVVNYHGVLPSDYSQTDRALDGNLVSHEQLRQQLQFLKAHYNVIEPSDFRAWIEQGAVLPSRAVLITCDDGLLNSLTDMLPILQSEKVRCLFFVTGASCAEKPGGLWYEQLYQLLRAAEARGQALRLPSDKREPLELAGTFQSRWWDVVRQASSLECGKRVAWMAELGERCGVTTDLSCERRWRLLDVRELLELAGSGMEIGAHTMSHPVLSECSDAEARREIEQSKVEIELVLGRQVWAFAYPFGNPSAMADREIGLVRNAGYICAFLNVDGGTDRSAPFALCRTHVAGDMNLAELEAHLTGFHLRLQRAVRA
jgi:peptidoglycan/xylan/chitin deacetylase (PgdA/CDA1 family)